jgi:hypothetical protein
MRNQQANSIVLQSLSSLELSDFARAFYMNFNVVQSQFDPRYLAITYSSLDLDSQILHKLFAKLPGRLRYYLMREEATYRPLAFKFKDKQIICVLPIRNEDKQVDFVRIRVDYKNHKIADMQLENIRFH